MPEITPTARPLVLGTSNDDILTASSDLREELRGLGGDDVFEFFSGDFSDHYFGGRGNDNLTDLEMLFTGPESYQSFADLSFNGGAGYDTLNISVLLFQRHTDLVLDDIATRTTRVEERAFDIDLRSSFLEAASVKIIGGAGDETIRLTDSTAGGSASVIARLGGGNDHFETYDDDANWNSIRVNMGAGRDTVMMAHSTDGARIFTGNGADTVQLDGLHRETLNTGNGNDRIYVLSGNHANDRDVITTGAGRDRLYIELDHRSLLAEITDFSAGSDRLVFNSSDISASELYFNRANAEASTAADVLYMDNRNGQLFYNDSLMIDFDGPTSLTSADFVYQDWLA